MQFSTVILLSLVALAYAAPTPNGMFRRPPSLPPYLECLTPTLTLFELLSCYFTAI
jgi:hypothetical protein